MRYYEIALFNPTTGQPIPGFPFTSFVNGRTDPGALRVELDIPVAAFHTPGGGAYVRIWGVPLSLIAQASNLSQFGITVSGGMKPGLPLATAASAYAGVLVTGTIFKAFGNWIGTEQTLDFIITTAGAAGVANAAAGNASPANIVLNWPAGMPLSTAISTALATAFPGVSVVMQISPNLVLNNNETGIYGNSEALAQYLNQKTKAIIGGGYPGVSISPYGGKIRVQDGSVAAARVTQIQFQDLIGQPTWLGLAELQIKSVMRADINIGDTVKLPPLLTTSTAQSFSNFRANSVFQGTFLVVGVHHFGNSRQPDAASWNTTIDLVPTPPSAPSPASAASPVLLSA